MKEKLSKEFSSYLEGTFTRKFAEKLEAESIPEGMRTLLEKEGALIAHEIAETDKNAKSIEELIELLVEKYWNGILKDFKKAA